MERKGRRAGSRPETTSPPESVLEPADLYNSAVFFYYEIGADIFRSRLVNPVTDHMLESLEAYKPLPQPTTTAEDFRLQRQNRRRDQLQAAQKLVDLMENPVAYRQFVFGLKPAADSPEYEYIEFLRQFSREPERTFQLRRTVAEYKAKTTI